MDLDGVDTLWRILEANWFWVSYCPRERDHQEMCKNRTFVFLHNSGHAWESAAVNRNMSLRKKLLNRQVRARFQICGYFFTSSLWICDMALVCCQFFSQQQKTYVQSYVAKSDQILHSNPSREGQVFSGWPHVQPCVSPTYCHSMT